MNKIAKVIYVLLIFFLILFVCILGLNFLNSSVKNEIKADGNSIALKAALEDDLYKVEGLKMENERSSENSEYVTLTIDVNEELEAYSVLIDHLTFSHSIYLNDILLSQNFDGGAEKYDARYAYKIFDITDLSSDGKEVLLKVKGTGISGIGVYLAKKNVMHNKIEMRIMSNTLMLLLMILMTLAAAIWYLKKQSSPFFMVFILIGIVSAMKAVCMGELSVLALAFGFSAENYNVWNSILSAANLFMPLAVIIYLLEIKLGRRLNRILLTLGIFFTALNGILGTPNIIYLILTIAVYITALALSVYGCVNGKRYGIVIFINNAIYSALVTYAILINSGTLKGGGFDFYIYPAYLGAEIYLLLFFAVFMKEFFREYMNLEEKKKEFERVALLRGIGHDLKLPLSVIKMNNQMLAKYSLTDDEIKECTELSTEAALELEKMTDNINSFLNLKSMTEKIYETNLHECFEKISRNYSAISENLGYSFSSSWEGDEAYLSINPLQLERMLGNLLDNALKYSEKGSMISLSCSVELKKICFSVSDNGIGMEKYQIEKIFEPFYRADSSRTKEGLGLGLAVVRGVAESMNGSIEVDSEIGRGTEIKITLPIK